MVVMFKRTVCSLSIFFWQVRINGNEHRGPCSFNPIGVVDPYSKLLYFLSAEEHLKLCLNRGFFERSHGNGIGNRHWKPAGGSAFCSSGRRLEKPAIKPTCRGKRFPDLGGGGQIRRTFLSDRTFTLNLYMYILYTFMMIQTPHVWVK